MDMKYGHQKFTWCNYMILIQAKPGKGYKNMRFSQFIATLIWGLGTRRLVVHLRFLDRQNEL